MNQRARLRSIRHAVPQQLRPEKSREMLGGAHDGYIAVPAGSPGGGDGTEPQVNSLLIVENSLDMLFSIALGIGLAAATGFRVFVPMLVAGLAARGGYLTLTESFAWLQSTPALIALATAATLETVAFYVPGVDHLLDVLAGPLAIVAGVLASASVMADMPAEARWPIAVIAGGGIAGITKTGAALLRVKSTALTGGLGNPAVSTAETASAATLSILAIVAPILCVVAAAALVIYLFRRRSRRGA